jgi:hypothetical protein
MRNAAVTGKFVTIQITGMKESPAGVA